MRDASYPEGHPVAIAFTALLASIASGEAEMDIDRVRLVAEEQGVGFGSNAFDEAAAMVGLPYSPTWDLYVPPSLWAQIELASPHPRVNPAVRAEVLSQIGSDPLM